MGYRLGRKTLFAVRKPCTVPPGIPDYFYLPPGNLVIRQWDSGEPADAVESDDDKQADAAFVARLEALENQDDDDWTYE